MAADQVLIGTNKGRRKLNRFARERRFGPAWAQSYLLMPDEKLICKQNAVAVDHKLINGNLFRVISESPQSPWRHATQRPYTPVDEPTATPLLSLQDSPEEWSYAEIFVGGLLENYYPDYEHIAPHIMMSAQARYNLGCLDFDYGYAITVHASQGSEWDHVVVCDDWEGRDRLQWLYTAVTRAKQKLIWVR
jgi:exodeoxyribonuclease-5